MLGHSLPSVFLVINPLRSSAFHVIKRTCMRHIDLYYTPEGLHNCKSLAKFPLKSPQKDVEKRRVPLVLGQDIALLTIYSRTCRINV